MKVLLFVLLVPFMLHAAEGEKRAANPTVTISNGTIVGTSAGGVESFKGIPFAQPPVGSRRLRPPVVLESPFGTITAANYGPACPTLNPLALVPIPTAVRQALATTTPSDKDLFPADGVPASAPAVASGGSDPEDCLSINVFRPAGTTVEKKLPVVVWMYGGGFIGGSSSFTPPEGLISRANSLGEPFLYASFNYRLAAFGFLASTELSDEGATNLGLKDQRLALQWVQDNIEAFGGDPAKVTIWGESAGSISVFDHLVINGGDNTYKGKALFRGAIMNSGTFLPAFPVSHPRPQGIFNRLVEKAGCGSAANKVQCLREVDFQTFSDAQNAAAGSFITSAIPFIPRPDPASSFYSVSSEKSIAAGSFAKVPMIIGDQEDEGTAFCLVFGQYGSSTEKIVDLLTSQSPELSRSNATAFVNTYPDQFPQSITEGSPFGTGLANELYPGFKRLAALYGDGAFTLTRRVALEQMADKATIWSYLATYNRALPFVGTTHGTDIFAIYYGLAAPAAVSESQYRYFSFINYGDPNVLGRKQNPGYTQWPQYTLNNKQLLNIGAFGVSYMLDNFRQDSYEVLRTNISAISI